MSSRKNSSKTPDRRSSTEGNRKGFKYIKKSTAITTDEDIPFDEFDNEEIIDTKKSSKRKSDASEKSRNSDSNKKSRNKSVSSQKTTRSDEKPIVTIRKRGKYPVVSYELNQSNISAAGDSTKVLRALLHDICETESLALQQCFQQSDWTLDAKGKKLILESLLTVLAALPEEMLLNCPANVEFLPEFSSETKLKIASLKNDRDVMKAHLAKLNTYVNDLSAMGAECNLSFSLTSIAQDSTSGQLDYNLNVDNISDRYDALIDEIESKCGKILQEANDTTKVITSARHLQEKLYTSFAKLQTDPTIPVDPKDLLRQLPKLY